jgi:hypothetical protein
MAVYCYADVGRFGLAHSLSAWARCVIWAQKHDVEMLAPIWLRPRIGPYLRRERDKRFYAKLFRKGTATSGLKRARLLLLAERVAAGQAYPELPIAPNKDIIVQFENTPGDNERRFFPLLVGHHDLVRAQLLDITKPQFHPATGMPAHIAIHVRLGDFSAIPDAATLASGATNVRLPMEWYADRLAALRAQLNADLPAILYSDGSDDALQPLLSIAGVTRAPAQESITDLLAMGQAAALISSGSGFSLWGAYLGGAPRLCHPGQSITPAFTDPDLETESGIGTQISEAFLNAVRTRVR